MRVINYCKSKTWKYLKRMFVSEEDGRQKTTIKSLFFIFFFGIIISFFSAVKDRKDISMKCTWKVSEMLEVGCCLLFVSCGKLKSRSCVCSHEKTHISQIWTFVRKQSCCVFLHLLCHRFIQEEHKAVTEWFKEI